MRSVTLLPQILTKVRTVALNVPFGAAFVKQCSAERFGRGPTDACAPAVAMARRHYSFLRIMNMNVSVPRTS